MLHLGIVRKHLKFFSVSPTEKQGGRGAGPLTSENRKLQENRGGEGG